MYATYEQYTTYLDGRQPKIQSTEFSYYSNLASLKLDAITFGNIALLTEVPSEVVQCTCEIAELCYIEGKRENGVSSISNDGYSESYDLTKTGNMAVKKLAKIFLSGTGLLYSGGVVKC